MSLSSSTHLPMNITCPHCSQALELAPDVFAALQGQPHFACPMCEGQVAVPEPASTEEGAIDAPEVAVPPFKKPKTLVIVSALGAILAVSGGLFFFLRGSSDRQLFAATKDQPFVNALGMKFVPVPGTGVLFCIHETRRKDYAVYAEENMGVNDRWKTALSEPLGEAALSGNADSHPVVNVSWDDSGDFCAWLSKKEGKHYRLPTDAEWSLAVGLGETENPASGDTPAMLSGRDPTTVPGGGRLPPNPKIVAGNYSDETKGWRPPTARILPGYHDGFAITAPVMTYVPNQFGVYDLGGNVWEWCADWLDDARTLRILRGASWTDARRLLLLSSFRHPAEHDHRLNENCGFRVVLELPRGRAE